MQEWKKIYDIEELKSTLLEIRNEMQEMEEKLN